MSEPIITQDLGIVSKQLNPIVDIRQLQNIIDTIGQNLENGNLDNPMISFVGDRTTGWYYDANSATLFGVSQGKKIFAFNSLGFQILAPLVEALTTITVTGTNVNTANVLDYLMNVLIDGGGDSVQIVKDLQDGGLLYVKNYTTSPINIYPTTGDAWEGLETNQYLTIQPDEFISIRVYVDPTTGNKIYFGSVLCGINANGGAVFQNLEVTKTLLLPAGSKIEMNNSNITNNGGYFGTSAGEVSLSATTPTDGQYQYTLITQSQPNGIFYLPNMENIGNGIVLHVHNASSNSALIYPPTGQALGHLATNTPLTLKGNTGGTFTYVDGYWCYTIGGEWSGESTSSSVTSGIVKFSCQDILISTAITPTELQTSNEQALLSSAVNLNDQVGYIENQYINVNESNGEGTAITSPNPYDSSMEYLKNGIYIDDTLPVGSTVLICPNFVWQGTDGAGVNQFSLSITNGNSLFLKSTGISLASGANVSPYLYLSANYNYLCVKVKNQWGQTLWLVSVLNSYNASNPSGNNSNMFTLPKDGITSVEENIISGGTNQESATVLNAKINLITNGENNNGVQIKAGLSNGESIQIFNRSGKQVKVYPAKNEKIETQEVNDYLLLAENQNIEMVLIISNNSRMWLTKLTNSVMEPS